jgi:3-oxoacyl-[acyl-carrier protein] reductase
VTGASRGIGKEIALAFGRRKAYVAVHYRREERKAREVARTIRDSGGKALVLKAEVADPAQVKSLVNNVVKEWGRLDVLVNNAGQSQNSVILRMTEKEWRDVIDTNLSGAFWCLKAAATVMIRQKSGCIINIGSLIGVRGGIGCANYAASKAALTALTKSAARELGKFGVRVHEILPGFHPTGIGLPVWEKYQDAILHEHVLGQLSDLSELSDFVVRLSGYKSVSGQVYQFDSRVG